MYPEFPAVLVRENIAAEYGEDIRTASQYISLLEWLKVKDPDNIPGAAFPVISGISGKLMTFDFFMPEWGYWSQKSSWPFNVSDIGSNKTRVSYLMPETGRALTEFVDLWSGGLIYVKNQSNLTSRPLADFPTLLLYFYDFFYPIVFHAERMGLTEFDASGYRIYALYGGQLPVLENEVTDYWYTYGSTAVAGKNAEIGEFLKFIEWLGVRENYTLLMYGEQDADYTLLDGKIIPLGSQAEMDAVRAGLIIFENSDYRAVPLSAPWNLFAEMQRLEPAYTVVISDTDQNLIGMYADEYGEEEFYEVLNARYEIWDTMDRLYNNSDTAPGRDEVEGLIGLYTEMQRDRGGMLEKFAELTEEVISTSEIRYTQ
jgi:hypothetical protein